jgi:hypothetical protein
MVFRNLELVRQIIKDGAGLDVSYAYDDLVFAEHGIFIIQFDDRNETRLNCYFQKECDASYRMPIEEKLISAAEARNYSMVMRGNFIFAPSDNKEEINIEFVV